MSLPLIVGELNPYGEDDHFALYPRPRKASGYRLATKIMGLTEMQYLRRFDRINLCHFKFKAKDARAAAFRLWCDRVDGRFVLLGAKVTASFGHEFVPFTVKIVGAKRMVILPHPSGMCRIWNEPDAVDKARHALHHAGILPWGPNRD